MYGSINHGFITNMFKRKKENNTSSEALTKNLMTENILHIHIYQHTEAEFTIIQGCFIEFSRTLLEYFHFLLLYTSSQQELFDTFSY